MRAIGIAIPFFRRRSGVPIDAQAQAHFNRVIADGGVVPSGLSGVNAFFSAVKAIYGTTDINTAISAAYDAHYLGYKLGAGSGTTLGQAAQKLYSCSGASGDLVQATAASQPLLLEHSGENYWFGSGVNGNYLSALTSASNITDDIEIGIYCDYLQKTNQSLGGKTNGGTYIFYLNSIGRPVFQALSNTLMAQSTVGVPISQGWLKASRKRGVSGFVKFFYSAQPSTTPIASINWIELSNVPETSNQPLTIDNVNVNFGAISNGVSLPSTGKIYRGWIANSIGGTPVVDFNPASYNPATSQSSWVSATSETWTINTGTATSGYKSALVDRSLVQLDRTDDSMSIALTSTMQTSLSTNCGFGLVATRFTNSNNEFVATLGGDFTANNSTQVWLQGSTLGVDIATAGTVRAGVTATGTYTLARRFSYVDNIVYGGTTTQVLNATSNSGLYFNNTTNKPTITSGNFVLGQSGFGRLNGNVFTFVMAIDGTKFNQLNTALRTFNNNFAL